MKTITLVLVWIAAVLTYTAQRGVRFNAPEFPQATEIIKLTERMRAMEEERQFADQRCREMLFDMRDRINHMIEREDRLTRQELEKLQAMPAIPIYP